LNFLINILKNLFYQNIYIKTMNNWHFKQAIRALNRGGIIAYPTESVIGIGCDPFNQDAVTALLELKQRSWKKGLILIAANYKQILSLIEPLTPILEQRVFATWPGAVTWLLPAKPNIPLYLRGKSQKLAVRVTAHPQAAALCQYWGGPLVSTSANIAGRPPAKTALKLRHNFTNKIDYILPGKIGGHSRPSEIRDAITNTILRV
jgi:L-threonylcarbamoyladenylate synthase